MNDKTDHDTTDAKPETHQQKLLESASAWLDGESTQLENRRLEKETENVELSSWISRQQIIRQALHRELGAVNVRADISAAVSNAVAQESSPTQNLAQNIAGNVKQNVKVADEKTPAIKKPFAGFAIAASVALAVFLGFQQPQTSNSIAVNSHDAFAQRVPAGNVQTVSLTSKPVTAEPQQPRFQASRVEVSSDMAAHLQQHYVEHAEQAAFSGSYGLLPYARTSGEF